MKLKQKINITFLSLVSIFAIASVPQMANATSCGGTDTSIISCPQDNSDKKDITDNGVWGLLLIVLNIMTAGVGIVAVGGIVYGSILYTSAGDSSEKVKKAVGVIMNVVIGIVAYVAMYAVLQFLIPGGIFS
jgi:hypothetical protein